MINKLKQIVGQEYVLTDPDSLKTYGKDWLKDYQPKPLCIVLPKDSEQVAAVVQLCNANKVALVPSGGRTGLSAGACALNEEVVLSLDRLNKILDCDPIGRTLTCQAGVSTQAIQDYARGQNLFFPVDFASKGSSQIGGNIATNAGGIRVLKYGNMRDWVIGLQAVTATGEVLNLNGQLYKNNSGYDLRNLIIGSEGTLAIVTQATLKLTNLPQDLVRVLCATSDLKQVLQLFRLMRDNSNRLAAFEYFPGLGLSKVLAQHNLKNPFPNSYQHYVLMEIEQVDDQQLPALEQLLTDCLEKETLHYVVISQNSKQLNELMNLRELLPETLNHMHRVHKNDISVPIPAVADFIHELEQLLASNNPKIEAVTFGHIGDGNLHINVIKPEAMSEQKFVEDFQALDLKIYALVSKYQGSISAEHGVGLIKKKHLHFTRSSQEIELMRAIKRAFDPNNILNPGKIFDY